MPSVSWELTETKYAYVHGGWGKWRDLMANCILLHFDRACCPIYWTRMPTDTGCFCQPQHQSVTYALLLWYTLYMSREIFFDVPPAQTHQTQGTLFIICILFPAQNPSSIISVRRWTYERYRLPLGLSCKSVLTPSNTFGTYTQEFVHFVSLVLLYETSGPNER